MNTTPFRKSGRIVQHKDDGRTGTIYHREPTVKGKPVVHWQDGTCTLVDPAKLKPIGFVD